MSSLNQDKTKNINELADEANQNTPLTPMGADELGATAKSADMMGTPAQVKANIQMQEAAQEQRLKQQEKEAAAEEQRLAGQTLTQQQRYGQPSPTEQQEAAANIAETMRTLGPVQSRVQGLIQLRLNTAQQQQATTSVDEGSVKSFMTANEIAIPNNFDVTSELNDLRTAIANQDAEDYGTALQNLYDVIIPDALKDTTLQDKFASFIKDSFGTAQGAIEDVADKAISADGAKLSELKLSSIGIDLKAVAKALQISEDELNNFTLEDLNAAIDAVEAQELGRVEELQNMLKDPTLTTSMRQAIYDELRQLGAAGVIGAEQDIVNLQTQIDEANVIELFGEEYTLEEALSDEGISDLIAKAAVDDDLLAEMKKDPKYQSLAQWVESNRQLVNSLLDEYEFQAVSFVDVQKNYATFRDSLGKDGQDVLRAIAEAVVPGIMADGKFKNSLTSSQYELFTTEIKKSALFSTVFDTETNKLKAEYSTFLTDLKKDPELVTQFLIKDEEGNFLYKPQDIQNTVALKNALESENDYFKLLYGGLEGYASSEDYFGEGEKKGLALNEEGKLDTLTKWQSLGSSTKTGALSLQNVNAGLYPDQKDTPFLSIDELTNINKKSNPAGIFTDLTTWVQKKHKLNKTYKPDGKLKADLMVGNILGTENFDARDLKLVMDKMDPSKKKALLDIFDDDGKNGISQAELNSIDDSDYKKLLTALGVSENKEGVINSDGSHSFKDILDISQGVGAKVYETDRLKAATDVYDDKWKQYDNKRLSAANKYGYTSVDDGENVVTEFNKTLDNVNSTIKDSEHIENNVLDALQGFKRHSNHNWLDTTFKFIETTDYDTVTDFQLGQEPKGLKVARPGHERLYELMTKGIKGKKYKSGKTTSDILNDIVKNGMPSLKWENGEINTQAYEEYVDVLKNMESYFAEIEVGMTKVIDQHINRRKKRHRRSDGDPYDNRTIEGVEAMRNSIIKDKILFGMLRSQAESAPKGQVSNYNKFYGEYSTAEKDQKSYENWFKAFEKAANTANGKAILDGKTYTFDQLLNQGSTKGWVTA